MRKEDRQAESWGDRLTTRRKGTLRVALQNVQRLPVNRRDSKHEDLTHWLEKDGIDIAILTESNTYWPKVKPHQQWEERSEGLFPQGIKSIFGYNKNYEFPGTVQYGGVGLLALGETRHRLCGKGEDSTGLGRWTWMRYQGRGDCHLRVIGAYRPNPKGEGDQTVHAQHQKYLLQQKDPRDPLVAFDQDLDKAIKQWSDMGDHIVVALGANDDLRNGIVKRGMARRGLREVLLSKHRDKPTVATFHRNTDGKPIDGIFATRGIKVQAGGYYAFDTEVKSPHRAKIYLNRLDIGRVCGEENLKRFWGSYGRCPFLQEPLLSEFGTLGINANANAVLQGTYSIPNGVPTWMTVYFNALRKPLEVKRRGLISDRVKTSDHRAYWKRAVESKSSEPRGLYNGHFKAGSTSELISQVDAALRHIPYCTGYAPANWCNITDLAIEKQPGNFSAERMRMIQLMAAKFNTNNKQLGRDMMNHAEACQILPEEHGGSRKGKQAVEQVLNKRLALDVTRQTRRAAGLVGTDAVSCYDRIEHVPTSISMQRLGVKEGPVASLFRTLQNSIHRIRTPFGDSGVRFVSGPRDPIQGIGQGNGVGPAGWIALSSPIMAMLRALGFGFWVMSALTYSLVYTMGFAFVDDTDLFHSGQAGQTGADLIPESQSAVNWWEKGISATGGSLVPSKSYWGLIDHHWNPTTAKWTLHLIADRHTRRNCNSKGGLRGTRNSAPH
jgi:hypothetical protein